MNTHKTYLTDVGIQKLTDELTELTEKQRSELAKRLRDAIKMGDLSENADYIAAKEDQAFICLLYTSPSPRDLSTSRMPSSA